MLICRDEIDQMSKSYRANFINGLSGYKSANLLGTTSRSGQTNLSIINSVFHLGAHPPLMGFICRPHSVDRHSLDNILDTGSYTFNHVHTEMIEQAHQTSARYPREQSEFDACGFEPAWLEDCKAPFVSDCRIKIGLNYVEHHTLLNETVMVIGEVMLVGLPPEVVSDDGALDISRADAVACGGLDTYFYGKKIKRLSYAKPDRPLQVL